MYPKINDGANAKTKVMKISWS